MTSSTWVQLNMMTGEIVPLDAVPTPPPRRIDAGFTAMVRLCGYEGQALTSSLRGALNKAYCDIKQAEREADDTISVEQIVELIDKFEPWFKMYRRERFNETCRRSVYPMECAKLWPLYRMEQHDRIDRFKADRERYRQAHPETMNDDAE